MNSHADHTTHEPAMIDCAAAVRMLWDYLDGHLDGDNDAAVRAHVTRCGHCFPHANFGQLVLDAVAEVRRDEPELTSLRGRVLQRLRAEGYDGP